MNWQYRRSNKRVNSHYTRSLLTPQNIDESDWLPPSQYDWTWPWTFATQRCRKMRTNAANHFSENPIQLSAYAFITEVLELRRIPINYAARWEPTPRTLQHMFLLLGTVFKKESRGWVGTNLHYRRSNKRVNCHYTRSLLTPQIIDESDWLPPTPYDRWWVCNTTGDMLRRLEPCSEPRPENMIFLRTPYKNLRKPLSSQQTNRQSPL